VSGRMVSTTAASVAGPRRDVRARRLNLLYAEGGLRARTASARRLGVLLDEGPMRRVCVPERYWLTTRPVVSHRG
jgi:hypothetical protein